MFQPCGKVCSMPSRYSTYLRSSTFVCIADTLSILVRLAYSLTTSLLTEGNPLYDSIHLITEERFDNDIAEINKAKATAGIRWLCFILGPLPQAIRLASFSGVPGTKIFGFGFLSSWLIVEFLILVSATTDRDNPSNWPSTLFEIVDVLAFWGVLAGTTFSEATLLGIWSQVFLLSGVLPRTISPWILALLVFLFVPGLVGMCFLVSFLFRLARWGFSRHLRLAETFLVAFPEGREEILKVDGMAVLCFMNFILHVTAFFMLYGFSGWYNPSGTVNPGWTGVFG